MRTPFKPAPLNIVKLSSSRRAVSPYKFPMANFICATHEYATAEKDVPAPMFRRRFSVKKGLKNAQLLITGLGHYEAYLNGANITKGPLAPYRNNLDHFIYFDCYDLTDRLQEGQNVLAAILGNGLMNGVFPKWNFNNFPWHSSCQLAFRLDLEYEDGSSETVLSDSQTKWAPSGIIFNDFLLGEYFDARLDTPGWTETDFDDASWQESLPAKPPSGEPALCQARPIRYFEEIKPVAIFKSEEGYIYDFGVNYTGVCRLRICGEEGQKLVLEHFERVIDGKPYFDMIRPKGFRQQEDEYTCRGGGVEEWMPKFTYHGFRYVHVRGLKDQQATEDLLTYVVMHGDLPVLGSFKCDNDFVNRLQDNTLRASLSNFFYFGTDCPHREKHGWTADNALPAAEMLHNFDPTESWQEWLHCVHMAMKPDGKLPGIIPTAGTNYDWGNGPAWDQTIVELPYQAYRFRGKTKIVEEAAIPLMRYLTYLTTKRQEDGLICCGLGDWCDVDADELFCNTPLVVTDSITCVDIARKAAHLFGVLGQETFRQFALQFAESLTEDIRRELIDFENYRVYGDTQTAQAMAMYYGIFKPEEMDKAMEHLLQLIGEKDDHFATGVLGARVLFRLLAEHGHAELALKMIIREDPPSYGYLLTQDVTALWEEFDVTVPPRGDENHVFWGDISAWFYRYLGGLRINPDATDVNRLDVAPCFVSQVGSAEASYDLVAGKATVCWKRAGNSVDLTVQVPEKAIGQILLPEGWYFADGQSKKPLESGTYQLTCK